MNEEINNLDVSSTMSSSSEEIPTVLPPLDPASGPAEIEESVVIRKPKPKKKRAGEFLKTEAQIKRRDALKASVKPFLELVRQTKARNANESDTSNIVHKFFQDVLGWDFLDITSEYKIRSTYCDLAVKYEGDVLLLIEVKAIGLNLKEEHLRQASAYAANEGVRFVLLTNGEVFRLYHVGLSDRVNVSLVWEVDLGKDLTIEDYTELYLISKHSLPKGLLEDYWAQEEALSSDNLLEALQSDEVIQAVVKYFRSQYDLKVDPSTIRTRVQGLLDS